MARFEVLYRSLVGDRLVEPGAVVELDPHTQAASPNLRPLDAEAQGMRDRHDERFAESAPPGSAAANEMRRTLLASRPPLTEAEVQAMYTYPRRGT